MTVPVLTAVTDAVWEADVVSALERTDLGVRVVRRCVDLADLLATAATGTARAVLLSAELRRLDGDALGRLAIARLAVVALVPPGDVPGEERLRRLGIGHVLPADAGPERIAAAVLDAVAEERAGATTAPLDYAEPRVTGEAPAAPGSADPLGDAATGEGGPVLAVWGPTGAPGRSTLAVGLAAELAELGVATVLADADTYGGAVGQLLGVLDEAPGLAAAARAANQGALDLAGLAGFARTVRPRLSVLTGLLRADRWPELRPGALEAVLTLARGLGTVVVDCGFCLEQDEELAYDTAAPRRNGATVAALQAADRVVAVGTADPVGLQRLVRGLSDLREAVPGVEPVVVVNRVRRAAVGRGDPERDIRAALARYAGVHDARLVPLDLAAFDAAVASGRTLAEAAPASPARLALQQLAADLAGAAPARHRRGWLAPRGSRVRSAARARPAAESPSGRAG